KDDIKAQVIKALAPPLRTSEAALASKLNSGNKAPILGTKLDWEVTDQIRKLIEANKFKGIKLQRDTQRHYPNGSLAAHILGTVNAEEKGVSGLEMRLDKFLRGQDGKLEFEKDAAGRAYSQEERAALAGGRIVTTLDVVLQHKVEQALAQALEETKADSISAIVMDPATGEILALANAPTFEPTARWQGTEQEKIVRRNRAIVDVYEPGSVMKMVTYSAVIEEGLAQPDDKINCRGPFMNGPHPISDTHSYGELTVAQALAKSSNVGTIRFALRLGKDRFADYVTRFGFGQKTGIDLPAEEVGLVRKVDDYEPTSLPSMSIGYSIGVTAIQAVTAMAAIANRGLWVQPHVLKKIVSADASQRVLYEFEPKTRRVLREDTADVIKDMLAEVVETGTARSAIQLASYTAAGKTGTAKKVVNGRYSDSAYNASFAGFVPATNPRFAIIVVLDTPKGAHQGGQVAAPIFNQIAQAALGDYGVLPDVDDFRQKMAATEDTARATQVKQLGAAPTPIKAVATTMPSVVPTPKASAKPTATSATAKAKATPTPKPTPKPTPILKLPVAKSTVRVEAATKPEPAKPSNAPNVIGRSLREVASMCSQAGLKLKANGSGVAKSQRRVGDTLIVEFK
ncbi:MAG TPA: penicillin-binding transpeptidase domain-containing protein, partial [Blastocatellia bacterium]|nr:penicillin-binding transpeptidase domain-containing protein [Blastocatellia bacterium]